MKRNKLGLKRTLFNGTRQCNIQMFDKIKKFQVNDKANQSCRFGLDKYITFLVSLAFICLVLYLLC